MKTQYLYAYKEIGREREKLMKIADMKFLDQRFLELGCLAAEGFPKTPQKPHVESLGEGGSMAGETLPVRHVSPPPDRLRSMITAVGSVGLWELDWDPGSSSLLIVCVGLLSDSERSRSSHTSPDEPCLLNETEDLCRPAIGRSLPLPLSRSFVLVFVYEVNAKVHMFCMITQQGWFDNYIHLIHPKPLHTFPLSYIYINVF